MATTEFNAVTCAAGFWGFESNFSATLRQAKGDLYWYGTFTGTDVEVFLFAGASYYVSIDGAAEVTITNASSVYVSAATGLSDTSHTIAIRVPDNAFFSNRTGTRQWLRITGAVPAIATQRQWKYLTDGFADGSCRTLGGIGTAVSVGSNRADVVDYGKRNASNGFVSVRFKANATKLYYYWRVDYSEPGYECSLRITVDGGTTHTVDVESQTVNATYAEIVVDLTAIGADGDHEYLVMPSLSGRVYAIGVEGTFGTTISEPVKMIAFGDSITAGSASIGHGWPHYDIVAQRLDWDFTRSGVGGETIATAVTSYTRVTGSTLSPDIVVIQHGVNDGITSGSTAGQKNTFKSNYTSVITSILTAYPSAKIVCSGMVPNVNDSGSTYWTVNGLISDVVTEYNDARVVFMDVTSLSGVTTIDGLHPDTDGYVTLADFMEPLFLDISSDGGGSAANLLLMGVG